MTGRVIADNNPVKIGFTTALSGNYAYIGQDVLRGTKDAINEANEKNILNRKIELIVEDNQADTKTAVTSYQLLKSKGVNIILSSFSSITEALAPLANQDKIILMYNAIPTIYAEKYDYVFKVYSNAPQEAEVIINEIKKSSGKIAVVSVNNPTSAIMKNIFSKELNNFKTYNFDINDNDFRTIIEKLKEDNIQNIIILGYPKQILNFVKQTVELNYDLKIIYTTSDGGSKDVVNDIESYIKDSGIKYILVGYGKQSKEIYYVFSYDMTKVLITGMKACQNLGKNSDDPECLKIELQKVKINSKSGIINMDNSRIAKLTPKLYTVKNKEIIVYVG